MAKKRQARHCAAHRTDGEPCKGWAVQGAKVCQAHGGKAPQVQAAAKERLAAEVANRLAIPVATTALEALQDGLDRMNGQIVWLEDQVKAVKPEDLFWGLVERRTTIQQGIDGPGVPLLQMRHKERRHPAWVALDDAIARRNQIAAEMRRLGVEERQAAVQEHLGEMLAAPFFGLLAELRVAWRLDRQQEDQVKAMIVRQIRALESGSQS